MTWICKNADTAVRFDQDIQSYLWNRLNNSNYFVEKYFMDMTIHLMLFHKFDPLNLEEYLLFQVCSPKEYFQIIMYPHQYLIQYLNFRQHLYLQYS
jgi:hypothetical protein